MLLEQLDRAEIDGSSENNANAYPAFNLLSSFADNFHDDLNIIDESQEVEYSYLLEKSNIKEDISMSWLNDSMRVMQTDHEYTNNSQKNEEGMLLKHSNWKQVDNITRKRKLLSTIYVSLKNLIHFDKRTYTDARTLARTHTHSYTRRHKAVRLWL